MTLRYNIASWCLAAALFAPASTYGYVGGASGSSQNETRVEASASLERGLIEPNENEDSWQDANWNLFNLGLVHTFGTIGPLKDVFVRVGGVFFTSPAEENERTQVSENLCRGTFLGNGRCRFYDSDRGAIVRAAFGGNFIHASKYILGFSVETNVPISVNLDKFANPRVDYVAGSIQLGVQLTDWLTYETNIYVGTGTFGSQNAQLAYTQLFGFHHSRFGVRVGPYADADVTERFDERYDAAYTTGFPEVQDRIRMARFGVVTSPYVHITDRITAQATYLQKLFGYDAPATRVFDLGVSVAF